MGFGEACRLWFLWAGIIYMARCFRVVVLRVSIFWGGFEGMFEFGVLVLGFSL